MLSDFLTTKQPLGPFRHEKILRRSSDGKAAMLIYQVKTFDLITQRDSAIVMGRRGSGKTAIVSAYLSMSNNNEYFFRGDVGSDDSDQLAFDIERDGVCVFINSWDQLDEIANKVAAEAHFHLHGSNDWSAFLPETAARLWTRQLWQVLFRHMYKLSLSDVSMRRGLPLLKKFICGEDITPAGAAFTNESLTHAYESVKGEICAYLRSKKANCLIIIDSLEEYPVLSPKFQKLIAGFLKCVNDFNDDKEPVRVLCCIPEEIEHVFSGKASNRLKDLSDSGSVARLRWRPFDLLKVVGERYRAFLQIHLKEDSDFLERISELNFSRRRDLQEFYSLVMPEQVTNRLGARESAISYIVRHTQLLPREFILILNRAIVHSQEMKGSWRYIEEKSITEAVKGQEPELADQILKPFVPLYPQLIEACKSVIPELPPIFTSSDVDRWESKLRKMAGHECDDPWSMAYRMGVIGYIDPNETSDRSFYEYGYFHYNSRAPIVFAGNREYCVHPIFSGTWHLKRPQGQTKCVYPAKIEEELWEE